VSGAATALAAALAVATAVLLLPSRGVPALVVNGAVRARSRDGMRWCFALARRLCTRGSAAEDPQLVVLLDLLVPALRVGLPVGVALAHLGDERTTQQGAVLGLPGRPGRPGRRGRAGRGFVDDASGWVALTTLALRHEAAAGRPLARVWAEHAAAAGSSEGAFVARAWGLSETLGAPLAESVAEAAAAVRGRVARARRLDVVVAGPQATARVLSLLPLAGPVVAMALGISPRELYSGVGGACALAGLLLLLAGRAWCARLMRSVKRPMTAAELR